MAIALAATSAFVNETIGCSANGEFSDCSNDCRFHGHMPEPVSHMVLGGLLDFGRKIGRGGGSISRRILAGDIHGVVPEVQCDWLTDLF